MPLFLSESSHPLGLCSGPIPFHFVGVGGKSFTPHFLPPPASSTPFLFRTSAFGKLAYVSRFLHRNNSHSSPLASSCHGSVFCPLLWSNFLRLSLFCSLTICGSHHCTPAWRLHITVELPWTSSPRALVIYPRDTGVLLLVGAPPPLAPSPGGAPCLSVYSLPSCFSCPHSACFPAGAVSDAHQSEDQRCPAWPPSPLHLCSVLTLLIPLSVPVTSLSSTCCRQDSRPGASGPCAWTAHSCLEWS